MNPDSEKTDLNSPQVLLEVPNEFEATAIVAALREHGIYASMVGGFTAGFIAEAPGTVRIIVKKGDLESAQEALAKIEVEHDEIDWSQVDVGKREDD